MIPDCACVGIDVHNNLSWLKSSLARYHTQPPKPRQPEGEVQSQKNCNLLCQGDLRNGPKIWTLSINTHKPIIQPWHEYTAPSLNLETVKRAKTVRLEAGEIGSSLFQGNPKKAPNKDLSINTRKPFQPWQEIHASSPKSGTCKESLNCMDS